MPSLTSSASSATVTRMLTARIVAPQPAGPALAGAAKPGSRWLFGSETSSRPARRPEAGNKPDGIAEDEHGGCHPEDRGDRHQG